MKAYLYVLRCAGGSYYVGSTTDVETRVAEHEQGLGGAYTSQRRPLELVYCCEFDSIAEAFYREHQVKRWSRAKKEALIQGDYEALIALSRRRGVSNSADGGRRPSSPSRASGTGGLE